MSDPGRNAIIFPGFLPFRGAGSGAGRTEGPEQKEAFFAMSIYLDRAKALRATVTPHYNCAQSVLLPFAEECGISREQALRLASNLGGGMRIAATCGAFVGAALTLGLCGVEDPGITARLAEALKETHHGVLDCADLLRINREAGFEKKPHCDAMVFEAVSHVERILRERGLLRD